MDHTVRIGRVNRAREYAEQLNSALLVMGPPRVDPRTLQAWGYYHMRATSKRTVARLADELEYLQETTRVDVVEHDDHDEPETIDCQGEN